MDSKKAAIKPFLEVVQKMFEQDLGELLVLHRTDTKVYLGPLVNDKGKISVKDLGLLPNIKVSDADPCFENGFLGCVCHTDGQEWNTLSFHGMELCDLPVSLSSTCHSTLASAGNEYGENLSDFMGNVYSGFKLMLDNQFIPVVLLRNIHTHTGESGMAVTDLRMMSMDVSMIRNLNHVVRESVEKHLSSGVDDVEIHDDQFAELFGDFIKD
ncbi:MAG: hypothetical protein KAI15_09230 [Gammaproteobacteria bacterium]|nr:hypothetical protein [Gammaproteobacteria bacterium]